MKVVLSIILSYLIGSFSSAYILGKLLKNIDIRSHGSGNAGATNALRVMGKKLGILTFLLDYLKGVFAVLISTTLIGAEGGLIGGIFAVIGHNWPVFLGFKGGKGVATSFGVLTMLSFPTALIISIINIIIITRTKYVSLGSILSLSLSPIVGFFINKEFNKYLVITTIILALLSIIRHKDNIKRLLRGTENKIGW